MGDAEEVFINRLISFKDFLNVKRHIARKREKEMNNTIQTEKMKERSNNSRGGKSKTDCGENRHRRNKNTDIQRLRKS
jgi:hypothetical protein